MLYNGYDTLMERLVNNTEKMVSSNPVETLALGYKAAKQFIADVEGWGKKYPVDIFLADFERCKKYCKTIEALRAAQGMEEIK